MGRKTFLRANKRSRFLKEGLYTWSGVTGQRMCPRNGHCSRESEMSHSFLKSQGQNFLPLTVTDESPLHPDTLAFRALLPLFWPKNVLFVQQSKPKLHAQLLLMLSIMQFSCVKQLCYFAAGTWNHR